MVQSECEFVRLWFALTKEIRNEEAVHGRAESVRFAAGGFEDFPGRAFREVFRVRLVGDADGTVVATVLSGAGVMGPAEGSEPACLRNCPAAQPTILRKTL